MADTAAKPVRVDQFSTEQDLLNRSFDPVAQTLVFQLVGTPDGINYYPASIGADGTLKTGGGGAGTVTSVAVSGGSTGLTTSGGPITGSGTITLGGTLAIANGGTGSATQNFVDLTTAQTVGGVKTFTSNMNLNGSLTAMSALPSFNFINTYAGQYGSAGFFMYSNASTMTTNAGVHMATNITDTGISMGSFAIDKVDHTGAYVSGLMSIDLNNAITAFTTHIQPNGSVLYDLGSPSNYFRNLYVATLNLKNGDPEVPLQSTNSPGLLTGLQNQVGGQIIDLGTNYGALYPNTPNTSYAGALLRLDGRTGSTDQVMNLQWSAAGGSEAIIMKVSTTGVIAPGTTGTGGIGTSSLYYPTSYISRQYLNSTAYLDGGTAGQLKVTGTFMPVQAITASAPAYVKGGMYFDTTLNKLRIGGATAWETVTSS